METNKQKETHTNIIINLLNNYDGLTIEDISEKTGISANEIFNILLELEDQNKIKLI